MYQFWALVAISPPALQCLPIQHPFTDISLSFTSKIMFLWLFESFLVVLSYASGNISLPALCGYRSACLTMPAGLISVHWYLHQFCFKNYLFRLLWTLSSRAIICWSNLPVLLNRSFKSYPPGTLGTTHCVCSSNCMVWYTVVSLPACPDWGPGPRTSLSLGRGATATKEEEAGVSL